MALSFTRSIRSLESDSDFFATTISIIVALLLIAWGVWFFGSQITLVETGQIIETSADGTILAKFPATVGNLIYREQPAVIRLQSAEQQQIAAIPATVLSTTTEGDFVTVLLYAVPDATTVQLFDQGVAGEVDLETGQLSPAMLFGQVSGQFVETPPVVLNPQP